MSKEKILIVNNNMHIGGVQRALVNLLKCVHDRYDITLALFCPEGELMGEIPSDVRILPVRSAYKYIGMTKHDVAGKPLMKLMRSFFAAVSRMAGKSAAVSIMSLTQGKIGEYDAAISYLHDAGEGLFYGGCNDFVLRHVKARRKCGFLHCDYSGCGADNPENKRRYTKFDGIAACSDGCRKSFERAMPELAEKTLTVMNCQDYESIRGLAKEKPEKLPDGRVNVLTVARLGKEKGVTRAIEAISGIGNGTDFHYYIVGDGAQRGEAEEMVRSFGIEKRVTFVGEKNNPYGYMAAADLLLIPSLNEAAPMVIGEAACLGTPVLSTETTSARDMVEETGFGWVCENSVDSIRRALNDLLNNKKEIDNRAMAIKGTAFNNALAVAQFDKLIKSGM